MSAVAISVTALALVVALAACGSKANTSETTATDDTSPVTGIIGAMDSEVAAIKGALDDVNVTQVSGFDFYEGTLDGNKIVVVQSGMGKVNAALCAQTLILRFGATRVINTGVAGNLSQELTINDFVVATEAVQHDFDASPIGFERGEVPYTGKVTFETDPQLREQAVEAVKKAAPNSKVLTGRICSGDQFISTSEQQEAITSLWGGLCCEMEGGAVAQVCYLNQVPFVIIRAISDDSDEMDFEQFQDAASRECAEAVITLCRM